MLTNQSLITTKTSDFAMFHKAVSTSFLLSSAAVALRMDEASQNPTPIEDLWIGFVESAGDFPDFGSGKHIIIYDN